MPGSISSLREEDRQGIATQGVEVELYLEPTQELSLSLGNSTYNVGRPIEHLRVQAHARLHHLMAPAEPFGKPSPESNKAVNALKIVIPGTSGESEGSGGKGKARQREGVQLDLTETDREMALLFSNKFEIDEVEAVLLWRRYRQSGAEETTYGAVTRTRSGQGGLRRAKAQQVPEGITQIFSFYMSEIREVCNMLTLILRQSCVPQDAASMDDTPERAREIQLQSLCADLREELTGNDSGEFLSRLFRQFAAMAQRSASLSEGRDIGTLWAMHYLRVQIALLESMYLYIYYSPDFLGATTATNVIIGAIMSAFGTLQANSRLLDRCPPAEVTYALSKIEAILGMISIESLGLALLLDRPDESGVPFTFEEHNQIVEQDRRLCQSAESIAQIHGILSNAPLSATSTRVFPLLLLGWGYILKSIPTFMVPGNRGGAAPPSEMDAEGRATMYERPIAVACHPKQQMLQKWQELLVGPLLCESASPADIDKNASLYKDSMNILLRAFSRVASLSKLPDQQGLELVWCLLYGQGDAGSVRELCIDFWSSAQSDPDRAELLTHSWFPYNPEGLPAMLKALDGTGSISSRLPTSEVADASAAREAYTYLNNLGSIVTSTEEYHAESAQLELPGVPHVTCSEPTLLSPPEMAPFTHRWHLQGSGWAVTLAILAAAVNHDSDLLAGWRALGVEVGDTYVETVLVLIESLGRADPRIFGEVSLHTVQGGQNLVDIVILTLNNIARNLAAGYDPRLFASALAILRGFVELHVGRILSWLTETRFFAPKGVAAQICAMEKRTSLYAGTGAILDLTQSLATYVASDQYGDGAGWMREKAILMRQSLAFVHDTVWTRFNSWTFIDPLESSSISSVISDIYTTSIAQCALIDSTSPLQDAYRDLADKLVSSPSPFDLEPIFLSLEGRGATSIKRESGQLVALRAEQLALRSVLGLVNVILSAADGTTAPLGQAMLDREPADGYASPLDSLIRTASSSRSDTRTAVAAAKGFARISRSVGFAASDHRGLTACFGDPAVALDHIQAVLADPLADSDLVTALWYAASEAVNHTPSLAYLCAGMRDGNDANLSGSILERGIVALQDRKKLWQQLPDQLLAIMTLFRAVFTGREDLLQLLAASSECDSLWDGLGDLSSRQTSLREARDQIQDGTVDSRLPAHQMHRSRLLARTLAVDLLRFALGSAAESDGANQASSSLTQSSMRLVTHVEALRALVNDAAHLEDDEDSVGTAIGKVQSLCPSAPISDLLLRWRRLTHRAGGMADYDEHVQRMCLVISNVDDIQLCLDQLHIISAGWTVIDAQDIFSAVIANLVSGLADTAHLWPGSADAITEAASRCSVELVADLPLRLFKRSHVDHRVARTITINADLLELSSAHEGLFKPDWSAALSHLTKDIPIIPWGSQLSQDSSVDQVTRNGLHLIIIYVLSAQPALGADSDHGTHDERMVKFLDTLAPACCQSLFYAVEQGMSAESDAILADLNLISSIISLAWQKRDSHQQTAWLRAIDNFGLISHMLNLLIRGFSTLERPSGENIFAPVLLRILASIAQLPGGAMRLVSSGVVRALDMTLTIRQAERGRLRPQSPGQGYPAWISMLDLIVRVMTSLPNTHGWMEDLLPFLQKSAPQLMYSCTWGLDSDECLARLAETKSALCIMRQAVGLMDRAQLERDVAFVNAGALLSLLSNVTSALSSQRTIKAILEGEPGGVDVAEGATQQDLCLINDSLLAIGSDIVQLLSAFTRASTIVCGDQESWRSVETLALPVRIDKTSSIRILTNFLVFLSDAEELEAPDSTSIPGSPATEDLAPLGEDTRKALIEATTDRTWLVCVAQAVMITQISAVESENIRLAKLEGRAEKLEGRKEEVRLDSIDVKALSSVSSRTTKSLVWNACTAFLREHVSVN